MISGSTLKKKKPFSSGKNCPVCHAADNRIALMAVRPIPFQKERMGLNMRGYIAAFIGNIIAKFLC
jgi:hypothetical protein